MKGSLSPTGSAAEDLCLDCGLCCNGVIFADVRLQPGDDGARLQALGLTLSRRVGVLPRKFPQPCAAFDGCRCRIYEERPEYCRAFECLLLKSVKAGKTTASAARGIIRTAHQRADDVRRLLRELGDADEHLPLSKRFRRTSARLERGGLDETTAERFGELTLAVHDLNLLVRDAFYR